MPAPRGVACPGAVAIVAVAAVLAALPAAASAGTAGQWSSGFGFDLPSAVSTAGDGHGAALAAWTTRDGVLRLGVRPSRTAAWSAARSISGPAYGPDVAIGAGRRAVAVWDAGGAVGAERGRRGAAGAPSGASRHAASTPRSRPTRTGTSSPPGTLPATCTRACSRPVRAAGGRTA